MTESIANNLESINGNISKYAKEAKRNPEEITLIAVSKKKPIELINQAFNSGHTHFGENYVQELVVKINEMNNPQIKWHFIGHLQRNKAKELVGRVHLIHTVDSMRLAETINRLASEKNIIQDCLIQVKLSSEETKHGCDPKDLPDLLQALNTKQNINIRGLMLIGTWTEDKALSQSEFRQMKGLLDKINQAKLYHKPLTELSMGMSHDYNTAIAEGATMIRIGTQIFGERI